ncbi:phage regulatory CII family protein [Azospirillum sp.]|uniref:phage regulatory CII family protein n=1 Tax=Azospirillum sp. TaxID=34012 RepID=UPI003D75786D
MTKQRPPLTVEDAATQALAILGDEGAARATGKSARLVRFWGDPDDDGHRIPLHQAQALDLACIAAGAQAPFYQHYRVLMRRAAVAAVDPQHPMARLSEVMSEVGDVAGELRQALRPDGAGGSAITASEGRDVLREIAEARASLDRLEADVIAAVPELAHREPA